MSKWPDYWQEAEQGNYQTVIDALKLETVSWIPKDYLRPIKLGEMYMASGQFAKAAESFSLAQDMIDLSPSRGQTLLFERLGAALWLAGQKNEALSYWQRNVEAIIRRKVTYVELSGGIKVALCLYYGAVSLRERELLLYVKKFMTQAVKRSVAENMPGPLARIVLNTESFESVLQNSLGYEDFETCLSAAQDDILLSRQLASVLLCLGSVCREVGNEPDAHKWFQAITKVKNFFIEPGWYLVKREQEANELLE